MLNREHPDAEKYLKEFDALWEKLKLDLSKVEVPKLKGYDGNPQDKIYKQHALNVRELQKKYSYLFTD